MTDFRHAMSSEIQRLYEEALRLGPVVWVVISSLALILACTIAFGIHP